MANPRGISKTPKKPQRNRTESDVRRSFAENLNIDDFPTGNAQNLPRQDHFRKIGSSQAEKEIERLLGHSVPSGPKLPGILRAGVGHKLPARYKKYIEGLFRQGEISEPVARYYLEYFPQGDSLDVPGQSGRASVLRSILREDAKTTRSGWMPIHRLGEGGQVNRPSLE